MRNKHLDLVRVFLQLALLFCLLAGGASVLASQSDGAKSSRREPIQPLPQTLELDGAKVALGERLFNDPKLARNNAMACAFCHQLGRGGADGRPKSITNSGEADVINAPTVFNAAFNFRLTWRGEFRTLEEQAEADLRNPRHAATDWPELLPKLKKNADYVAAFRKIYRDDIRREHVLDAIATFERSLITPNSPFDHYLRGDYSALTIQQKEGYALFKSYGCISCHQGINVGGNLFQKIGVFADYLNARGGVAKADLGRFNVTKEERDKHVFRVPSLRNVALTAPYFHDGQIKTLPEAVEAMGRVQLGVNIPSNDVRLIVAFLESLTGEYKGRSLAPARSGQ